jgi:FKBP-type peptidyl-prolyl cis-trans isomerase 2
MRRTALLIALTLALAACGGSDEETATTAATAATTIPDTPDGEVTTTTAPSPGEPGIASPGDLVSVDYTGTLADGTEFDTSIGQQPLQFTIGAGQMIAGFDSAVEGMAVGETKTVTFGPDLGYGERNEDLIIEVPIDQVPAGVAVGDELISPVGQVVTVIEVGDEFVTLDTNPPLAGETLTFEITLVSIDG